MRRVIIITGELERELEILSIAEKVSLQEIATRLLDQAVKERKQARRPRATWPPATELRDQETRR
jgi:hypothetical protein